MSNGLRLHVTTALVLAATFALGAVSGVGIARLVGPPPFHRPPHGGPRSLPPPFGELDLSAEQERHVHEVIEKHRPELEAIMRESRPRVQAIHDRVREEVAAFLSPEQRERLAELEAHRPPHGPRGGGPPGGPPFGPPPFGPPPFGPPPFGPPHPGEPPPQGP